MPNDVVMQRNKLLINREMVAKRREKTYEECRGMEMTPAQREVFLIVDEWWKQKGFGPSIRDICELRGKGGMGNTSEIIGRLVKLGVLKKVPNTKVTGIQKCSLVC